MPTARCTECNKSHRWRNQRGNKLSNARCSCGGKLEMVGGSHALSGEHPFEPKYTYHQKYYEGTWFYAEKNRAGDYFVYHQGFFHKIENPVLANPLPWGDTKPITEAANADNS